MQTALLQEPWCFHEAQVAALTDWQIVHRYLEPAAERADRLRDEMPGAGGPPGAARPARPARPGKATAPDHEPGTPEHRRQLVEAAFVGTMGMKREAAERYYDGQLAAWRAEQAGG